MASASATCITDTDPKDKRGVASGKIAYGQRVAKLPKPAYGNKR